MDGHPSHPHVVTGSSRRAVLPLLLTAIIFLAAISVRIRTVSDPHAEHDEQLYAALVQQLEAGRGYTLQGHPILEERWVVTEQYDRPLFYHPPGGIAFFWVFHHFAGPSGLAVAQLVSFSIFYWSLVALGRLLLPDGGLPVALAVAVLAAFTPIVAHAHTHYWLDGPQLAFATAAAALFVRGLRSGPVWLVAGGLMLAWACATKLTAILVLPAFAALCWNVNRGRGRASCAVPLATVGVLATLAISGWLWVQWRALGEIFPAWAGRPAAELVANNPFVRFVTEVRGPWSYLRLLPQALVTLVPALLALPWLWGDRRTRRLTVALGIWIAGIVLAHVALGYIGYSKLLRYVILVTPATVLLFALAVEASIGRLRVPADRPWAMALLGLSAVALVAESWRGLQYVSVHAERALILLFPDVHLLNAMGPG